MKHRFAAATLTGAFLCVTALAQSTAPTDPTAQPATTPASGATATQPANSEAGNPKRLAPGSLIPVELTRTIDAKKAKTGDQVVAKVTQDMRSTTGQVVIAKDTKVIGHVTGAQPRSKEQKESQLALAFDRAVTKDGQEMQMPMSIQAVVGQENQYPGGGDQGGSGNSGESSTTNPRTVRSPMSGSTQAPPSGPPPSADNADGAQTPRAARPPINAHTQGVVGISNLSLQPANGNQGSVMTSEKNNVKLESGTMLLLKVNQ